MQITAQSLLLTAIKVYQYSLSALIGPCCRFEPSCSSYAIDAITKHGSLRGCMLLSKRLLRCHPWHPGGCDPVP